MKKTTITLVVNDETHTLPVKPGETLASLLRERLRLTGTKIGCDEAECGACTVLVDDEPVLSCVYPAARADGRQITTFKGLEKKVNQANVYVFGGSSLLPEIKKTVIYPKHLKDIKDLTGNLITPQFVPALLASYYARKIF